jgi:hypothetical protein
VLRVVLPDLKCLATSYVSGQTDANAFVASLPLVDTSPWQTINLAHPPHRWMYDYESFSGLLERLGYMGVYRPDFGTSILPSLAASTQVEDAMIASISRPQSSNIAYLKAGAQVVACNVSELRNQE